MPKVTSKYQGKNGVYYLRNPGGAIAMANKSHARARLQKQGWFLATDAEIELYRETKVQRWDAPIAEKWSPEPEVEAWVPDEDLEEGPDYEATEKAEALAKEQNVDLAEVEGTGAGGRILVSDVQAVIDARAAEAESENA